MSQNKLMKFLLGRRYRAVKETKKFLLKSGLFRFVGSLRKVMSVQDWMATTKDSNAKYITIYPATSVNFRKPKSLPEEERRLFSVYDMKLRETFVASIPNGRFIGKHGSCITSDKTLLEDVSIEFGAGPNKKGCDFSVITMPFPKEVYHDNNVAVLDSAGAYNYYHWVINVLVKIEFFEKSGIKIDHYLVHNEKAFQQASLDFIGFPTDKIIPITDATNVRAKNLVVAGVISTGMLNLESLSWLQQKFFAPKTLRKRIFITRKNAAQGRKILNENELFALAQQYGFESFELETLSFKEQVELFSSAEVVLAPHGAGLTNMIFCPSQTKIIELFNPNYMQNVYTILSDILGLDYYYLSGENYRKEAGGYDCSGDIQIDLTKLERLMNAAELKKL